MSDRIELSEESLLADAVAGAGGLTDFGDERFLEGLRVLLSTYERAGLRSGGRKRARGRILQLLTNRLKIEQAFKEHPEIREHKIEAPLYLTGLPRTGTSALFNLLGVDAANRPLLLWEGIFPDPLGKELAPGQEDPRLVGLRAYYEHLKQKDPAFDAIHFVNADGPEECVLLLAHTFCDVQMGVEPLMSPFREFFEAARSRSVIRLLYGLVATSGLATSGPAMAVEIPCTSLGAGRIGRAISRCLHRANASGSDADSRLLLQYDRSTDVDSRER